MNLNGKFEIQMDKNRTYSKKDLLNNSKIKLINLILSKKPISLISNLKYNNIKLANKINNTGRKYSLKNLCLPKATFGNNMNNVKKMNVHDLSNYKNSKNKKLINKKVRASCNNLKNRLKNKSFYLMNKSSYEIPKNIISFTKKEKNLIKNQKSESIKRLKFKKSKSISISRNLNMNENSLLERKFSYHNLSNNKINCSINGNISSNNNNYLNKNKSKKNLSQDLKYKISLFVKEQKLRNSKKLLKFSYSVKSLKNIKSYEKNNTFRNITTNNSDKEMTDFSTKKNNLTNHSNIPYITTNYNISTNITETNNNQLILDNKLFNKKRIIKKKIGLPFHPNSKKLEYDKQLMTKSNLFIRNNKSEINIPYNKKRNNNKNYKIKRDTSPINNYRIKLGKFPINHSARNKKNINDSFFELYLNTNNDINNYRSKNNIKNTFFLNKRINNSFIQKNKNYNIFNNDNIEKEEFIGFEIAHFKIVAAIQENKKLLNKQEK